MKVTSTANVYTSKLQVAVSTYVTEYEDEIVLPGIADEKW